MAKIYAVVKPGSVIIGGGISAVSSLVQALFHHATYESILRYSLGHQPDFFTDLSVAKATFDNRISKEHGILELEMHNGYISKVHKHHYLRSPNTWDYDEVFSQQISSNALAQLNRHYHATQPSIPRTERHRAWR